MRYSSVIPQADKHENNKFNEFVVFFLNVRLKAGVGATAEILFFCILPHSLKKPLVYATIIN